MKKIIALLLAGLMVLSLCACGGYNEVIKEPEVLKEELLSASQPMNKAILEKCVNNIAFAKSLTGNTYTFTAVIDIIGEDCVEVSISSPDKNESYGLSKEFLVGKISFSQEELLELNRMQTYSIVGTLEEVTVEEKYDDFYGDLTVIIMNFSTAVIVSDRLELTGVLHSMNKSYGDNSWNIKYPGSDYLGLVYFEEDVSEYEGQEITFSFRQIDGKKVDAKIIK